MLHNLNKISKTIAFLFGAVFILLSLNYKFELFKCNIFNEYANVLFATLVFIFCLDLLVSIIKNKLYAGKRIVVLLAASACYLFVLGITATLLFTLNGVMQLTPGRASNKVFLGNSSLTIVEYKKDGAFTTNTMELNLKKQTDYKQNNLTMHIHQVVKNAVQTIAENVKNGCIIIELDVIKNDQLQKVFVKEGELVSVGSLNLAFNKEQPDAIQISNQNNHLVISSGYDIITTDLNEQNADVVLKDSSKSFTSGRIYKTNGVFFIYRKQYNNAAIVWAERKDGNISPDLMQLDVTIENKTYSIHSFSNYDEILYPNIINHNNSTYNLVWNYKHTEIPYSLYLNSYVEEPDQNNKEKGVLTTDVSVLDTIHNVNIDKTLHVGETVKHKGYHYKVLGLNKSEGSVLFAVTSVFWSRFFIHIAITLFALVLIVFSIDPSVRQELIAYFTCKMNNSL